MRLIVGISGATGACMGLRLLQALASFDDVETYLVVSEGAKMTIRSENAGALEEYEVLAADTNLPVHATAALGVARCMALAGDKEGALKKLEASDDPRAKNLAETVKRYDPNRKAVSLFDAANAAAGKIEAEKKDSAAAKVATDKPVEAKPVDKKPAEAKPAEQKPADKK